MSPRPAKPTASIPDEAAIRAAEELNRLGAGPVDVVKVE